MERDNDASGGGMQRRLILAVLMGVPILLVGGAVASAQAPEATAPVAGGSQPPQAAPGDGAAATDADLDGAGSAEPVGADRGVRLFELSLHGALVHAQQGGETSRARGAFGVALGVRAMRELQITGAYEDSLAEWSYAFAEPALDGAGPNRSDAFEHRHLSDLFASWDFEVQAVRLHVVPRLGLTYVALASEAFASSTFGGGGGLVLRHDLDPQTGVDAAFRIAQGFTESATDGSLYGSIRGLRSWSVGVSLGATDGSYVRMAYVGEALVREFGTRWGHGAELSLHVNFL